MTHLSNIRKFSLIAVLAIMASVFSSCENEPYVDYPDDPYATGLLGIWDYSFNENGDIQNPHYVDSFGFMRDGTGYYAYENDYGQWVNIAFTWRSFGLNYLEIYYENGDSQSTYYHFDQYGYLIFGNDYEYDGYQMRP